MPDSTEDLIASLEFAARDYATLQTPGYDPSISYSYDQSHVTFWEAAQALRAAQADLAGRDAVIAEVRTLTDGMLGKSMYRTLDGVILALRKVPADALDARDERIVQGALAELAMTFRQITYLSAEDEQQRIRVAEFIEDYARREARATPTPDPQETQHDE